ncbi:MAG: carboxypeptidase regulatory-like domain-containing protein [Vicinamibacterales bacterium]
MRRLGLIVPALFLASALACGGGSSAPATPAAPAAPVVDPATAGSITASVAFEGAPPPVEMVRLDADSKCVAANGASERPAESILLGPPLNSDKPLPALQNVFVYVKDGLGNLKFPVPSEPVVLDQQKCRYTPRVLGIRVGQPLTVRNSDPLLHNVRSDGKINTPFNMGEPLQGVSFDRTFTTSEVMVPFKCDVHAWMNAWVGVLDHPFFGTTSVNGQVSLSGLPPGTYTIEAWHETLGTKTATVTIAAKESKDVSFTFAR